MLETDLPEETKHLDNILDPIEPDTEEAGKRRLLISKYQYT
jgi:hypothetical protein